MPGTLLKNAAVLSVLGLLLERPLHLYALSQELRARLDAAGLSLGRGSIRNVLNAIEEVGWVTRNEPPSPAGRPVRAIYTLTEAGVDELHGRVREQIADASPDHNHFVQAVAYLGLLDITEAVEALRERATALERTIDELQRQHSRALSDRTPELFVIEVDYLIHQMRAEVSWIRSLNDRVERQQLTWPRPRH